MTNQPSPVEEQEKLLEDALNVVKVQVIFNCTQVLNWLRGGVFDTYGTANRFIAV